MNRHFAPLRCLLLACAAALSACVTSPYYTPSSGSVYYVQDPWFYRNSYRDCYDVWYGCSRPSYGHSYYGGHYPPPVYYPPPPSKPPSRPEPPPDDKPVYAPKPPRLIRLGDSTPAPGRVIAPASPARTAPLARTAPKPLVKPQSRPAGGQRLLQVAAPAPRPLPVRPQPAQRPADKPVAVGHARVLRDRPER